MRQPSGQLCTKRTVFSIENVQRRATKLVRNIQNESYTNRMKELGLPSLQYRRKRADMIELFKIIKGIDKADAQQLFKPNTDTRTRGNSKKLKKNTIQA